MQGVVQLDAWIYLGWHRDALETAVHTNHWKEKKQITEWENFQKLTRSSTLVQEWGTSPCFCLLDVIQMQPQSNGVCVKSNWGPKLTQKLKWKTFIVCSYTIFVMACNNPACMGFPSSSEYSSDFCWLRPLRERNNKATAARPQSGGGFNLASPPSLLPLAGRSLCQPDSPLSAVVSPSLPLTVESCINSNVKRIGFGLSCYLKQHSWAQTRTIRRTSHTASFALKSLRGEVAHFLHRPGKGKTSTEWSYRGRKQKQERKREIERERDVH